MRILLVLFLVLSISGCAVVAVGTAKVIGSAVTPGDDKPAGK